MAKRTKSNGSREKPNATRLRDFLASSMEASSTAGEQIAPSREKLIEPTDVENTNAPALPSELRPAKTDWSSILNLVVLVITGLAIIGGVFFWFAKLDSKVDAATSDLIVIKPKVDQLVINSEKHDIRIGNLEKIPPARDKGLPKH